MTKAVATSFLKDNSEGNTLYPSSLPCFILVLVLATVMERGLSEEHCGGNKSVDCVRITMTLWCGELQQASTAGQMSILDGTLVFDWKRERNTPLCCLTDCPSFIVSSPPPCPPVHGGEPQYMGDDKMQGGRVGPGQGAVQSGSLPCSWSGQQSPL